MKVQFCILVNGDSIASHSQQYETIMDRSTFFIVSKCPDLQCVDTRDLFSVHILAALTGKG